jgi:subtilisin family serine protease
VDYRARGKFGNGVRPVSNSLCLRMTQLVAWLMLWPGLAQSGEKQYVISSNDLKAVDTILRNENVRDARTLKYSKAVVASLNDGTIRKLKQKLPTAIIEEDHVAEIAGKPSVAGKPTAPSSGQSVPWGLTAIQARDAHLLNRGAGVRICIVDTGIQFSHPDLLGQVIEGENFVANTRGQVDPAKYDDDNGHGTHVAGTIAALDNDFGVVGVAPDADLIAVKVASSKGYSSLSLIAEGVRSCIARSAHVINISLATVNDDSFILGSAVQEAHDANVVVVAAAGNYDGPLIAFPARYSEVIAVTAIDSSYALAGFSSWGPEADFTAPGVAVYSTYKNSRYLNYDGTSMAAPHVTGVVALGLSSASLGPVGVDIGLIPEQQGQGLINALSTVVNF